MAQDNHLIDVCRLTLLYVPLYKMRYVQVFLINSQILTIAVRIFVNEARRCVPYPVGTKKGGRLNCWQRLYSRCLFTRRHLASLPSETEAPSSVCGKNKYICCRHLFDEYDPKHHVQRYVRDPQATPHSISKACKNKEQCIAVCALHLNAV